MGQAKELAPRLIDRILGLDPPEERLPPSPSEVTAPSTKLTAGKSLKIRARIAATSMPG